jgi:hypothetical protein
MSNRLVSKWLHEKPRIFFAKALELFGEPTFVANVPNGMAYWNIKGNSLFSEHFLKDEMIEHCVPAKHHDFLYSSIKCYIPEDLRKAVLSISGSIHYDGLKKLITARCASIEANIATLYLGMSVANGNMKIAHVKKAGLYGKYIRGEMEPHTELKKEMMIMKRENSKKYKNELNSPFDPLAFPKC